MSSDLATLVIDANDPVPLAGFWAGVLRWDLVDEVVLLPSDDPGIRIGFVQAQGPRPGPNQMHFDLTSTSLEDQQATVGRALELGGRHIDVGQLPEEGHVVLADPEGNEFCVIEPDNKLPGRHRVPGGAVE